MEKNKKTWFELTLTYFLDEFFTFQEEIHASKNLKFTRYLNDVNGVEIFHQMYKFFVSANNEAPKTSTTRSANGSLAIPSIGVCMCDLWDIAPHVDERNEQNTPGDCVSVDIEHLRHLSSETLTHIKRQNYARMLGFDIYKLMHTDTH